MLMKLYDFTEPELRIFRKECNFTDDELQVFNLKAKNKSIVYIAMQMNISEAQVSKLTARIKKKILKVIRVL